MKEYKQRITNKLIRKLNNLHLDVEIWIGMIKYWIHDIVIIFITINLYIIYLTIFLHTISQQHLSIYSNNISSTAIYIYLLTISHVHLAIYIYKCSFNSQSYDSSYRIEFFNQRISLHLNPNLLFTYCALPNLLWLLSLIYSYKYCTIASLRAPFSV